MKKLISIAVLALSLAGCGNNAPYEIPRLSVICVSPGSASYQIERIDEGDGRMVYGCLFTEKEFLAIPAGKTQDGIRSYTLNDQIFYLVVEQVKL